MEDNLKKQQEYCMPWFKEISSELLMLNLSIQKIGCTSETN